MSMWFSLLFFFSSPLKPRCQCRVMGFVDGAGNIAIATSLSPSFCVSYCNHQIVHGISISYFYACLRSFGFRMWRLTLACGVLCQLSASNSVVTWWARPRTLVTWPWRRLGMAYCCALRLWSLIWATCWSCWLSDFVALSCAGAGCFGPELWRNMHEMDVDHFANRSLSVVVSKCWFLNLYEFSLYRNHDLDDWIFDYLLTSMAVLQAVDMHAPFLLVSDLNDHHMEWLGSTTTNIHGVAAFDCADGSGCDQLVFGTTHARGGTLDLLMSDVPDLVGWCDYNSTNVCPCACRKRRLILGDKLSYTTGLPHAWFSCMQCGKWVWTVGHWVVLVQVIYCSKGGWVLYS